MPYAHFQLGGPQCQELTARSTLGHHRRTLPEQIDMPRHSCKHSLEPVAA